MKCVIFCGGKGTRLREETDFKPKPLVNVGGKPILWHIMKIYEHFGIDNFILPLGYKGDMIKRYFMEYRWRNNDFTLNLNSNNMLLHCENCEIENWEIVFKDTGLESATARRLNRVKEFLEDEEDFCITYGDGVADVNIEELIKYHKKNKKIMTVTGINPRSKYGLIETNDDMVVTNFSEKPMTNDIINAGFMVVNKRIFDYLDDTDAMMVHSIMPELAKIGEVIVYHFEGFWHCMDTYKDYEDLNKIWNSGAAWKVWE
jgi:glucose-1-phosphate cytidylyltransferase